MKAQTQAQIDLVHKLRSRFKLSVDALDTHCRQRFNGQPFDNLDRYQTSALIDEMVAWKSIPADLQRALGQLDMFG